MCKIKLITFDLDDTFWDIKPIIINAEYQTRAWIEKLVGKIEWGDVQENIALRKKFIEKDSSLEWDISELRKYFYRHFLKTKINNEEKIERYTQEAYEFFLSKRNDVIFFNGVLDTLEEIHKTYKLGVLTNGNADLKVIGINKYFEFLINAKDAKANKPDIIHFKLIKKYLPNIDFDEILHVGDCQVNDMLGASNAGMKTLWFNKNKEYWGQSIKKPPEFDDWNNFTKMLGVIGE